MDPATQLGGNGQGQVQAQEKSQAKTYKSQSNTTTDHFGPPSKVAARLALR